MSSNIQLRITNVQNEVANEEKQRREELQKKNIALYIEQLTEQQKIVLNIARDHLATSFCIEKSLGYLSWLKSQQIK